MFHLNEHRESREGEGRGERISRLDRLTPFHCCLSLSLSRQRSGHCANNGSDDDDAIDEGAVGNARRSVKFTDITTSYRL